MIKKKTEFKQIEGGYIANKLALAALDDWYLVHIMATGHTQLIALVSREVEVTKENLWELIHADFKSEIGGSGIRCEEHNRLGTFIDSEKVQDFMLNTARRYKLKIEFVRQMLILNLEELTWVRDKEDEEES